MQASELYQTKVFEHHKSPRHYGELPDATHISQGHNPICGDIVDVMLLCHGEEISQIQFTSKSCALCKASASMMCDAVQGKKIESAKVLFSEFKNMITGKTYNLEGDVLAFNSISEFPARAKCVLLPWKTLEGALLKSSLVSTEEPSIPVKES